MTEDKHWLQVVFAPPEVELTSLIIEVLQAVLSFSVERDATSVSSSRGLPSAFVQFCTAQDAIDYLSRAPIHGDVSISIKLYLSENFSSGLIISGPNGVVQIGAQADQLASVRDRAGFVAFCSTLLARWRVPIFMIDCEEQPIDRELIDSEFFIENGISLDSFDPAAIEAVLGVAIMRHI